jgi:hypothetical protein
MLYLLLEHEWHRQLHLLQIRIVVFLEAASRGGAGERGRGGEGKREEREEGEEGEAILAEAKREAGMGTARREEIKQQGAKREQREGARRKQREGARREQREGARREAARRSQKEAALTSSRVESIFRFLPLPSFALIALSFSFELASVAECLFLALCSFCALRFSSL